jgi:hypothetical protein
MSQISMSQTNQPTIALRAIDASFREIKARYDERHPGQDLLCKQGFYKNCSVLKLQKPSWTNDPMGQVRNRSGIFFSIWINGESAKESRANYNIHALKLRELKSYRIASKDFAEEFRKNFVKKSWPNVSVDYDPLTLMEGWEEVALNKLEEDIPPMLERFRQVSPLLDHLLDKRSR